MAAPRCGAEEVYYRNVGERRRRPGHLGESRGDRARLSWALCGEMGRGRERERREGNQVQQPGGQRYKKGRVMFGLHREEPLPRTFQPMCWAALPPRG